MLITLVIGATAIAASNVYGVKNYSDSKTGNVCTVTASADYNTAAVTKIKNTASSNKYMSCMTETLKLNTGERIDYEMENKVLGNGSNMVTSSSRYYKSGNRKFRHVGEAWSCAYQPSGSGWTNYHADFIKFEFTQTK